ncbi:MAG: Hsp70 family protein, partial [Betaproteobacteria bacterium]|nr:Hsp70 family protein [Betaproteobacteria bacterium]
DITRMLQEGFARADSDARARALREEQVEAERLLDAIRAAMAADRDLLSAAEQADIHAHMTALSQSMKGDDHLAIRADIDALAKATDDFAARRMNRSVAQALTGRRVAELGEQAP